MVARRWYARYVPACHLAAARIQGLYRTRQARRLFRLLFVDRREREAAIRVQAWWRVRVPFAPGPCLLPPSPFLPLQGERGRDIADARARRLEAAATLVQAAWRGCTARRATRCLCAAAYAEEGRALSQAVARAVRFRLGKQGDDEAAFRCVRAAEGGRTPRSHIPSPQLPLLCCGAP